ncbi:MAG: hypothetical protein HKP16_01640, partial [Xanthomonadales bacterium]|nr:hypothetical protein [Xanthomonadales bacterium]
VFIGVNLDNIFIATYGKNFHMAVGSGMAALIAGASIANLPSSTEIITKVATVKDFFITLFFVALGVSIPMPESWDVIILAVSLAIFAIIARQLIFFPLFYWTGVDQRNAQVSSIRLAQISEFGLVICFLGAKLGHLSPSLTSAVIFAFVITALATPILYGRAYEIHSWIRPALEKVGFKAPPETGLEEEGGHALALLGFHRDASSLLYNIAQSDPELVKQTLVVDFNVALHSGIAATGATVKYGDLANPETLHHLGLNACQVIVCTIPDDLLRGITNRQLVHVVREMAPHAAIIANAIAIDEIQKVYEAGADYVYLNRFEAAWTLQRAVQSGIDQEIDQFRNKRQARNHYKPDRKEILS